MFHDWLENEGTIVPNLRSIVYRYGMEAQTDSRMWFKMLDKFVIEKNAGEKNKLRKGLAWFKEPEVLHEFVEIAKNESVVRSQDYFDTLIAISNNPVGAPIVWDFVREEWSYLVDRFGLNDRHLGKLPKSVTEDFATQSHLDQVKEFFKQYPEAGAGSRARKQAVEGIQNNIKWLTSYKDVVDGWLQTHGA